MVGGGRVGEGVWRLDELLKGREGRWEGEGEAMGIIVRVAQVLLLVPWSICFGLCKGQDK